MFLNLIPKNSGRLLFAKYLFCSSSSSRGGLNSKMDLQNNQMKQDEDPLNQSPLSQNMKKKVEKPFFSDQQLDKLTKISSFLNATKYASEQKFELAEINFQDTLNNLENQMAENQDIDTIDLQIGVMKKTLALLKIQEKNDKLKQVLEKLFFMNMAYYQFKDADYLKLMRSLFTHYCIYDLDRGMALTSAIFSEEKLQKMKSSVKKEVLAYQGLMNGLKGLDFEVSQQKLNQALDLGLAPVMKGVALNNLAMFIWWKNLKEIQDQFNSQEALKIIQNQNNDSSQQQQQQNLSQDEFKLKEQEKLQEKLEFIQGLLKKIPENQEEIIKNLKDAIHAFEFEDKLRQKDQLSLQQYALLKDFIKKKDSTVLFDQINVKDFVIKNPMSCICALNIGEFYFQQGSFQAAQFWLSLSLTSGSQTMQMNRVLRGMVLQAQIMSINQREDFAEKMLIDCLQYSEGYMTFNKVFALEVYCELLKKQDRIIEANAYTEQISNLRSQLKYWDERKENLIIPDYYLQF